MEISEVERGLLEACKEMLGIIEDFVIPRVDDDSVANVIAIDARAAIAKVEGPTRGG